MIVIYSVRTLHVPGVPSIYKSAWSHTSGVIMLVCYYWFLCALVLGVLHEQKLTSTHPPSLHYYVFLGSLFHLLTNFLVRSILDRSWRPREGGEKSLVCQARHYFGVTHIMLCTPVTALGSCSVAHSCISAK